MARPTNDRRLQRPPRRAKVRWHFKVYVAEAERAIKTLEQAPLALRYMDLTGLEGPLLADIRRP